MPISNQNVFAQGNQFPPEEVRWQHEAFDRYFRWYNGHWVGLGAKYLHYAGVTSGAIQSVNRELGFEADVDMTYPRLTDNLFRYLVDFWQDAVLEDAPTITGQDNEQPTIDLLSPSLLKSARIVVGDIIRYGVGVFVNRQIGMVQAVDPRWWFPVRAPYDTSMDTGITVLAWPYSTGRELMPDALLVETYRPNVMSREHRRLKGLTIGADIMAGTLHDAPNMDAVVAVRGDEHDFYGTSDYLNAAQFVEEIHRRESQTSKALDRHANPHLAVPESAMSVGEDGRMHIDQDGMVIPVPDTATVAPQYIVWDAKFESQQHAINRAFQAILRGSRIAPILAMPDMKVPQLASGAALRRLAIPTVARIKELRANLEDGMRAAIRGAVSLLANAGQPAVMVDVERLEFDWPPALSSADDDIMAEANGNQAA